MSLEYNPVSWFELYVSDMGRAQKFYETVFNTTLEALPSPDPDMGVEMLAFHNGEEESNLPGAAGALAKMEGVEPGAGGTLVYFSCADCAEEESRVAAAGGQVARPKFSIGQYGFISILVDTEGNTIGLHSKQ